MSRNRKDGKKGGSHKGGKPARSCKNNGGCPWCESNRKHSTEKQKVKAKESVKEWRDAA